MSKDDVSLAPIAGWEVRGIEAIGAITIRVDYLTHPMQTPEQANQSPNYVLTAAQCRELAQTLERAATKVGKGVPQGTGIPKH